MKRPYTWLSIEHGKQISDGPIRQVLASQLGRNGKLSSQNMYAKTIYGFDNPLVTGFRFKFTPNNGTLLLTQFQALTISLTWTKHGTSDLSLGDHDKNLNTQDPPRQYLLPSSSQSLSNIKDKLSSRLTTAISLNPQPQSLHQSIPPFPAIHAHCQNQNAGYSVQYWVSIPPNSQS